MTEKSLPEPRADGLCCECVGKPAVTNDGRFCKKCLSQVLREREPVVRDLNRQGTDTTGRKQRSPDMLGGVPHMSLGDYYDG